MERGAEVQDRTGDKSGTWGKELICQAINLTHKDHSPNWDRKLSAEVLTEWKWIGKDNLIFWLLSHFIAPQYLSRLIQSKHVQYKAQNNGADEKWHNDIGNENGKKRNNT